MYKCEKHGKLETEWCDKCSEIKQCDCSDMKTARFKDLFLDTKNGERTITVYIKYCNTCGKIANVKTNKYKIS